ncbi:MAG TPA: NTPase [Thermoplasmata archaeon]|nr:NTPase [Thermoplasmata archaeon]HEV2429369.1 NTPase [Thermoplasmata archaeon]
MPRRLSAPIKIAITGMPGSGKTQTLLRIIQLLEQEGVKVGGMVTEPIIERQRRSGFQITDWMTKEHEVFAHEGMKSRVRSGKYGVNVAALEGLGARSLAEARESADVIVIDEVGKMEVESESFSQSVVDTLDANKSIVMTLHKKSRNPLLQDIRRRDELRLLEVTPVNKNLLAFKIVRLLTGRTH